MKKKLALLGSIRGGVGTSLAAAGLLGLLLLSAAEARPRRQRGTAPHVYEFNVLGMTCDACANSARGALEKNLPGIERASVDFSRTLGRVESHREIPREEIRDALATLGFEAMFPGDPPPPAPLTDQERARLDIRTISRGEEVHLPDHLPAGKVTILDFYAKWCGPCHLLTPRLEHAVREDPGLALRKIDLVDWKSPVAKQLNRHFEVPGLPYVQVYGPDGELVGWVHGNQFHEIRELIRKARGE